MMRVVHAALMNALVPKRLSLMRLHVARQGWSKVQIREYQDRKVRELVAYCWNNVPYYQSKWSKAIGGPDEVRGVDDLAKLPILSKDELRENLAALTTTDARVKSSPARSGGSTGRPTIFRMTRFDEEMAWAHMYTAWRWAGWRYGDAFLAVGGQSIGAGLGDNRTWKDWVIHRWVSSGSNLTLDRTRALVASGHFREIRLVYGYPSAIFELCDMLRTLGARPPRLRGVVCTAEVLRPEVRAGIEDALGVHVHDQWGLNDGGLFAAEGPDRDGLHLFFMRGVLEIVDADGKAITTPRVPGRAIGTCLTNLATPFVRYETGDDVHWYTDATAASGIGWPRIGPVDGRTGDVIHLPSGRRIAMPGLTLVMRWIDGLRQYQFIQIGPATVIARLDRAEGYGMNETETIGYLREKISDEIDWRIEWGPPELTQNQKVLIIRNDWRRGSGRAAASGPTTGAAEPVER